jgi:hypothetical protein
MRLEETEEFKNELNEIYRGLRKDPSHENEKKAREWLDNRFGGAGNVLPHVRDEFNKELQAAKDELAKGTPHSSSVKRAPRPTTTVKREIVGGIRGQDKK